MLDALLQLDARVFLWLHHNLVADWADLFFPFVTDMNKTWGFRFVFVPGVIFGSAFVFRRWSVFFLLCLILSVAASDMIGSQIMKPTFDRPRPNVAGLDVNLKSDHFGGKSFPSNHSANMFALATFLSMVFRRWKWAFYAFAATIAYSRIYVGVHYPLDVIGGAALGIVTGYCSYRLLIFLTLRYAERLQMKAPLWLKSS